MISDNIVITVVDVRGGKIRIGVDAPLHVQVHRKEVFDELKRREKDKAAAKASGTLDITGKK